MSRGVDRKLNDTVPPTLIEMLNHLPKRGARNKSTLNPSVSGLLLLVLGGVNI